MTPIRLTAACTAAAALVLPTASRAADLQAGKAKAEAVCAACHGANGVSVSDSIPNLAGQRGAYLEAQLRAWKDGSRKNAVMNAIGAQLTPEEISNVAAWFAALPAAGGAAKSAFLPALARSPITLPADYRSSYVKYLTINFAPAKQVRTFWANPAAVQAAKAGQPLPDGAMLVVEVQSAKLDADKNPVTGPDGYFVPDQVVAYTTMAREAGWGAAIPDMLRNENWSYAVFTADRQPRTTVNQAECLACHKPLDKTSYVFTLDKLAAVR